MFIPFETFNLFFLTAIALALVPGPDNIFVLTQSVLYGRQAGILVTLGLCTGVIFHTALVAFGVAAIFAGSTLAFTALKMSGAVYLLYLAWGAFRQGAKALDRGGENVGLSLSKLYTRGVIMNVTNPKVAIFFLAFFPQFTKPTMGNLDTQIMTLGAIFNLVTFFIFSSVACFAGHIGNLLRKSAYTQIVMNRIAGFIFFGLAVRLVFTDR